MPHQQSFHIHFRDTTESSLICEQPLKLSSSVEYVPVERYYVHNIQDVLIGPTRNECPGNRFDAILQQSVEEEKIVEVIIINGCFNSRLYIKRMENKER